MAPSTPTWSEREDQARARVELRRRAEDRLREAGDESANGHETDLRRLVHELRVHQIELELQNEELAAARLRAEREAARFSDLFEFAPAPYVSLDSNGTVLAVNQAAARLLGEEKARITGGRLGFFVSPRDRTAFNAFLADVLRGHRDPPTPASSCWTSRGARPFRPASRASSGPVRRRSSSRSRT